MSQDHTSQPIASIEQDSGLSPFRVTIFTGASPQVVARLIDELRALCPGVVITGVLYHHRKPVPLPKRIKNFFKRIPKADYQRYVFSKTGQAVGRTFGKLGQRLVYFIHAAKPTELISPWELMDNTCKKAGCKLLESNNLHSSESLEFVELQQSDLGIVFGTPILKPSLFAQPKHGCVNVHQRKLPDYRGGGPVGLWEMLDQKNEIGVSIHRVTEGLDAGAIVAEDTITIQPYDTLRSLSLKAHVIAIDLLVKTVNDHINKRVEECPQVGEAKMFRAPKPWQMRKYEKQLAEIRPRFEINRDRPSWKLLVRSILFAPKLCLRNRRYRRERQFPVVSFFHHIVTDRPHFMGISTDVFIDHINFLKRYYRLLTIGEAVEVLKSDCSVVPAVLLTFDDGYRPNHLNLRAAMLATDFPAVLYLCSEHIEKGKPFEHDEPNGTFGFHPLNWDQVRDLKRWGYEIGSHTRNHFDCGSTNVEQLKDEIVTAGDEIEANIDEPVPTFSFPFGMEENISEEAVQIAAERYNVICSAYGGINYPSSIQRRHLKRCSHNSSLWELELAAQGILEISEPTHEPIEKLDQS